MSSEASAVKGLSKVECRKSGCIKTGEKKCGRCKNALYCSKECQVADWKRHKKTCKLYEYRKTLETESKQEDDIPPYSFHSMFNLALKKIVGESTSLAVEYLEAHPNERYHSRYIDYVESHYCQQVIGEKSKMRRLKPDDFGEYRNFVKRWCAAINDGERLHSFVDGERRFGDIYIRTSYPCFQKAHYQTMRNTSIANQMYEFGHTYVGFGFVDLFQIVWGHYKNTADEILTFYGWDMNRVTVLRSKLIYIIFKYFQESEINTRSALQIWFSSCWDSVTLKAFNHLIQQILSDTQKYALCDEDIALLRIWKKIKIKTNAAKQEFSSQNQPEYFQFDDVWRMKEKKDRVMFSRYIFTGCIFAEEDITVCGNPTMFTSYQGQRKHCEESFFKGIDLHASSLTSVASGGNKKESLFDTITFATLEAVLNFRELVYSGKIVCHLQTKFINTSDMSFAAKVKSLDPFGINWSNLPDYMKKESFIKFARACSADETIHHLHFLNWTQYVFGSCHVDWVKCQEKCNEMYDNYTKAMEVANQNRGPLEEFFSGPAYVYPLNGVNVMLAIRYRQKFEDFFLSDENGKVLNRFKSNVCESAVSSFFDQSPTMFKSAFTFNDSINLRFL